MNKKVKATVFLVIILLVFLLLYSCGYKTSNDGSITKDTKNNGTDKINGYWKKKSLRTNNEISIYIEDNGSLTKYVLNGSFKLDDFSNELMIEGKIIEQLSNENLAFSQIITTHAQSGEVTNNEVGDSEVVPSKMDNLLAFHSSSFEENSIDEVNKDIYEIDSESLNSERKNYTLKEHGAEKGYELIESVDEEGTARNASDTTSELIVPERKSGFTKQQDELFLHRASVVNHEIIARNDNSVPIENDSVSDAFISELEHISKEDTFLEESEPSNFYVKADIRAIRGGAAASSVPDEVTILSENDERNGWSLGAGYTFTRQQAVELTYVDLGPTSIDFETVTPPEQWTEQYHEFYPKSSQGITLQYRYFKPLMESISLDAGVGLGYWKTTYEVRRIDGFELSNYSTNQVSPQISFGINYSFSKQIFSSLRIENIFMEEDNVNSIQLEIAYRF